MCVWEDILGQRSLRGPCWVNIKVDQYIEIKDLLGLYGNIYPATHFIMLGGTELKLSMGVGGRSMKCRRIF